jgi:hypothetical protein
MPNWCYNNLDVTGEKEEVKRFREFAKAKDPRYDKRGKGEENELSFHSFIPYPDKYLLQDIKCRTIKTNCKDGYNQGGYEWCANSWGTKWNAGSVYIEELEEGIRYSFDTAWAPPIPVVIKMGEMFPELKFKLSFSEEGMGFEGDLIVENGEQTHFEERDCQPEEDDEDEV